MNICGSTREMAWPPDNICVRPALWPGLFRDGAREIEKLGISDVACPGPRPGPGYQCADSHHSISCQASPSPSLPSLLPHLILTIMCNFPNQISNHSPWTTKFQNMHEDDSYQDSDITNNLHIWGICRVKLVLWGDEVIAHSVKNKMSWMKSIKRFFKFFLTLYLDKILCQCVHWRTHHSQNFKKKIKWAHNCYTS